MTIDNAPDDDHHHGAIAPDTQDWTWVLDRVCPECGFDTQHHHRADTAVLIGANATTWAAILAAPGARERARPDRWSPLEYACHVRDVHTLYNERLQRMLHEHDPLYANWDQDATAVEQAYATQDPATVSRELVEAARRHGDTYDSVGSAMWTRTGRRSDGAEFTVESISRYMLHDIVHHIFDVGFDTTFTRQRTDGYRITDDAAAVDLDYVTRWLTERSYWAKGRAPGAVERGVAHSTSLALLAPDGTQAGYCRWVTDHATFAWLCDVFVDEAHRGLGLGAFLVDAAMQHPAVARVPRFTLGTRDAHGLYAKFGFAAPARPDWRMEIDRRELPPC